MTDLYDAFRAIAADAGDRHHARSGGLDATGAVAEAGRRRRLFIATVAFSGVAAAAVLVVGGATAATLMDSPPPLVAATPAPTVTPTASPSPSAPTHSPTANPSPSAPTHTPTAVPGGPTLAPTPSPSATQVPDPVGAACRSAVPAPGEIAGSGSGADRWMGNYGGGVDADPGAPIELLWAVMTGEDWSDRPVTASIDELWLVRDADPATAVAGPADALPAAFRIEFVAASEGGGGGSEARVELTMPFVPCADGADDLPVGVYRAVALLTLDDGSITRSVVGDVQVFVGGYEAATAAS
jgi:hypothetical protein